MDTPVRASRRRCWWCRGDIKRVNGITSGAQSEDAQVLLRDATGVKRDDCCGRGSGSCAAYAGCALWWASLVMCWVFCAYFFSYM